MVSNDSCSLLQLKNKKLCDFTVLIRLTLGSRTSLPVILSDRRQLQLKKLRKSVFEQRYM